jgi:hypothetical protein
MKLLVTLLLILSYISPAQAAPGAHGPNGEHLDGPGGATTIANAVPQVETFSELFELVGTVSTGEMMVLIDRYDTNEPVLNGKLEVEYGSSKATATFQPGTGGYAVTDAGLLKALAAPGTHSLLFTFIAGDDSDLLEGTLTMPAAPAHGDDHGHGHAWPWLTAGIAAVLLLIVAASVARRRKAVQEK